MGKQKKRLKLEGYLRTTGEAVMLAISTDDTAKYNQLMKRVIKQYKKAVKIAENLENYYLKPLIKIDRKIINELRRYNQYKRSDAADIKKSIRRGKNLFKRIEDCLIFNHENKNFLQTGKSILAHCILLGVIGVIVSTAQGESDTGVDYNNLPKTIEDSDIEQYEAFDENKKEKPSAETAEEEKEIEQAEVTDTPDLKITTPEETKPAEKVKKTVKKTIPEKAYKDVPKDIPGIIKPETPTKVPEKTPGDFSENIQNEFEVYVVKKGNTLWGITKKYYKKFADGNIAVFIDELLSPLNNKGRMNNYEWGQPDERNPHLIFPRQEIKVPDLKEVDPLSIPKELRDLVKHDNKSSFFSAKATKGKIILINYTEKKIVLIT